MKETRFKQTDIGLIPQDWEVTTLTSAFDLGNGYTPSKDNPLFWNDGNIPWFRIEDIKLNGRILSDSIQHITEYAVKKTLFPADSFIISTSATIGEYALLKCESLSNQRFVYLIPKKGSRILNSFFLHHCYILSEWCKNNTDAGSSFASVNMTSFKGYLILHPTCTKEQQRIAEALGDVDKLIASLERLIEKKRMVKQGTMQQLLTGKRRLPGFDKPWVEKSIGKHCSVKARIGWQGLKSDEYLSHGEYFLVGGTDFKDGRVDWANCKYVSKMRFDQDRNIQLKLHDCLISKDGTIGKVAFVDELVGSGTLNSGVFVVRSKDEKLDQSYLSWIFLSPVFNTFMKELVAGSTIMHLYQKDIVKFSFFVPSDIEEQRAIAKTLTDMDAEIAALEAKLNKYKDIKSGMMQQLLTGKIRLI